MSEEFPTPGSDDVDDSADFEIGDIEAQASSESVGDDDVEALQDQVNDLEERIEIVGQEFDEEFTVFVAAVGTDNSWGEVVPVNGVLSLAGNATASDWRHFTNDTSSGAGLIQLGAGQSLVLQAQDGTAMKFIQVSAAAKRAGNIVSVQATTDNTTWVQNINFTDDGSTASGYNRTEWKNNGTTSGAIMGNPGSLGGFVGTDGKTTGGCQIKPPGPQYAEFTWEGSNSKWWFDKPNSAF